MKAITPTLPEEEERLLIKSSKTQKLIEDTATLYQHLRGGEDQSTCTDGYKELVDILPFSLMCLLINNKGAESRISWNGQILKYTWLLQGFSNMLSLPGALECYNKVFRPEVSQLLNDLIEFFQSLQQSKLIPALLDWEALSNDHLSEAQIDELAVYYSPENPDGFFNNVRAQHEKYKLLLSMIEESASKRGYTVQPI